MRRALVVAICTCALLVAPASAAPSWAPASGAAIHPGVQTFTDGAQCATNFVFYDASNVYLVSGRPLLGHRHGDRHRRLHQRLVAPRHRGRHRRQPAGHARLQLVADHAGPRRERRHTCAYNDPALVKVDPADLGKVNRSVPFWGGPTGLDTNATPTGDTVLSFGNSELRGGVTQLSPKQGKSLGDAGTGWSHTVYTVTPGIPGDSGSAFLNAPGLGAAKPRLRQEEH